AIHAGLEIVAGVTKISGPVTLACRVGVCSGPVVVGEFGDSGTWSMDAVGETPNIAARLQTLAAANTVLISQSTRRLVSAAFDFQDLGLQELKGVTEPLHVYRVLSARNIASRFEAAHAAPLTPLIGRSTELSLLLDRWQKVKEGDGQVIFLSGIPGVGKSRLLHELKSHIQQEPHVLLHHQCSPYHSQSAFFPVIEQIEQAAQLTAREADADKIAKLKAYLPRSTDSSIEPVLLIAKLLSIPAENHLELSGLTPQQIKNRTISTLVDMLLAFSVQRPTLCIFEDAHWLDASTLELLELEPISKSPEQDNEAGELNKAQEVLGVVLPADEDSALPLDPGEEALNEPAAHIAGETASILRRQLAAIGAVWRDHLDAVSTQLLIQRIAIVGAITDQILRLCFDHVEVEAQLHQADFMMVSRMRAYR